MIPGHERIFEICPDFYGFATAQHDPACSMTVQYTLFTTFFFLLRLFPDENCDTCSALDR
jgi:hypothetical protein